MVLDVLVSLDDVDRQVAIRVVLDDLALERQAVSNLLLQSLQQERTEHKYHETVRGGIQIALTYLDELFRRKIGSLDEFHRCRCYTGRGNNNCPWRSAGLVTRWRSIVKQRTVSVNNVASRRRLEIVDDRLDGEIRILVQLHQLWKLSEHEAPT